MQCMVGLVRLPVIGADDISCAERAESTARHGNHGLRDGDRVGDDTSMQRLEKRWANEMPGPWPSFPR